MSINPALAYRPDIDGLRAIAVMAVVLYHFGFGLPGGFVGVDVFFVISGFLITGIIRRELEQGRFTFAGFYERRARRIFPALFVMLTMTLIASYLIFLPSDMILASKSLIATLLFGSNIFFWRNNGYFDTSSDLNPLLHTWSLAVEEQFYFVFPIFLVLAYSYAKKNTKLLVWMLFISSLLACVWYQGSHPSATFYLAPFRAWELLFGALLALNSLPLFRKPSHAEIAGICGLAMLLMSVLFIPSGSSFPGWHATIPVIGTALLLHSGASKQTAVCRMLSLKPIAFIGLISYSLYLWHWPIYVFANYFNALELLGWRLIPLLALVMVVSYFSYRWVEKPVRDKSNSIFNTKFKIFGFSLAAIFILFAFGMISINSKAFPERFKDSVLAADNNRSENNRFGVCSSVALSLTEREEKCKLGARNSDIEVVVWGDSHAYSWAPSIDKLLNDKGVSGILIYQNACPPLFNSYIKSNINCRITNQQAQSYIQSNNQIKTVIFASRWSYHRGEKMNMPIYEVDGDISNDFFKSYLETLSWLDKKEITAWTIGPLPYGPKHIKEKLILRNLYKKDSQALVVGSEEIYFINAKNRTSHFERMAGIKLNSIYSRPYQWICNESLNKCNFVVGGKALYNDDNHLSLYGASYLSEALRLDADRLGIFDTSVSDQNAK